MANLEVISKRVIALEKEQEAVKCLRDMLKGELEANTEYVALKEEQTALNLKIKQIKDEILANFQDTIREMEEHLEEISTLSEILDTELKGFWVADPINNEQITTANGVRKVLVNAKVAKKTSKHKTTVDNKQQSFLPYKD
jgi:hypothetical protein